MLKQMIKTFYPGCFLKTFIRIITYYTYFITLCLFYFTIFRFLNCILCSTALYLDPVAYTLSILA